MRFPITSVLRARLHGHCEPQNDPIHVECSYTPAGFLHHQMTGITLQVHIAGIADWASYSKLGSQLDLEWCSDQRCYWFSLTQSCVHTQGGGWELVRTTGEVGGETEMTQRNTLYSHSWQEFTYPQERTFPVPLVYLCFSVCVYVRICLPD